MRLAETDIDATGGEQKQFYRVGGIAALVLAIGYVVIFPLYAKLELRRAEAKPGSSTFPAGQPSGGSSLVFPFSRTFYLYPSRWPFIRL
jgi:hypothetical protein